MNKTTQENPFEWLLRAASHDLDGLDVHTTLDTIGKMWQDEEQPFVCKAKKPFWEQSEVDGVGMDTVIPPCADHTRYVRDDRSSKLCMCVIEPYQQSMKAIEELISFCKARDLTFTIDGESSHFPGGCFRVVVKKTNADSNDHTAAAHLASVITSFIEVHKQVYAANDQISAVALDTVLHYRMLAGPSLVREPSVQNYPDDPWMAAKYLVENLDDVIAELQKAREKLLQIYGDAPELGQED